MTTDELKAQIEQQRKQKQGEKLKRGDTCVETCVGEELHREAAMSTEQADNVTCPICGGIWFVPVVALVDRETLREESVSHRRDIDDAGSDPFGCIACGTAIVKNRRGGYTITLPQKRLQ